MITCQSDQSRQVRRRVARDLMKRERRTPLVCEPVEGLIGPVGEPGTPGPKGDRKGSAREAVLFALAFAAALTGCATTRVIDRPLADRVPAGLLTCRDRPPAGSLNRQSDVARWVVELDAAGEDCRSKLAGVEEIVRTDGNEGERR